MDIEEPVACGYVPAFDFHAALPGVLRPTLIGDQVIQVREPHQKRLLIAAWMVKPFHGEQFPLDGVVGLIEQGAGDGHLRVFKDGIPARFSG